MAEISAVGIFCEDAREEKSGQVTLVGILPDTINVPAMPGMLAKLAVYIRVHISPPDAPVERVTARLLMPNGDELVASEVEREKISAARAKAVTAGNPILGFILRFTATPLMVQAPGRFLAEVTVGEQTSICGALTIELTPPGDAT
ncbi:MAG: DUF6941 family protein [Hyphomicrobiaceae bacterium]